MSTPALTTTIVATETVPLTIPILVGFAYIYHMYIIVCCLQILFLYRRVQVGYYVQTIIPSFLLVAASFGSLWVPSDQIPGRMSLAVTTTLTLMGMINSVFQTSPDTAYLKVTLMNGAEITTYSTL